MDDKRSLKKICVIVTAKYVVYTPLIHARAIENAGDDAECAIELSPGFHFLITRHRSLVVRERPVSRDLLAARCH